MRFVCAFLIGLVALTSVGAAQSLPGSNRGYKGWSSPQGPGHGPRGPSIRGGPSIFIPLPTGRSCPEGTIGKWPACVSDDDKKCPANTTGKWPKCKPKSTASCADKGLVGKWPKCREPDEPTIAADPCPEGQVRKGKKCVELTKGDGGKKAVDVRRQYVNLDKDALKNLESEAGVQDWRDNKHIAGDRCAAWIDGRFLQGTFTSTRVANDMKPDVNCGGAGGLSGLRNLENTVLILMGDGSVRNVARMLELDVWKNLGSRNDGNVIPAF